MFGIPKLYLGLGLAAVLIAAAIFVYMRGRGDERTENEAEKAVATAEALKSDQIADDQAGTQRVEDAEAVAELREELVDAVQSVPDSVPAPAAVALGCQRLRRAYGESANLPAVCRPDPGSEAAPAG